MLVIIEEMGTLIKMVNGLIIKNINVMIAICVIMMLNAGMHLLMVWKVTIQVLVLITICWDLIKETNVCKRIYRN